jgi:phosphinothricin acetyltransferase
MSEPVIREIVIRNVRDGHIPSITRIYADAVLHGTATFEIEPPDMAEMARRMAALVSGGYPYVAAEAGGNVVGYAYAGPYRARPAYRWSVENSIYVDRSFHRRGIGMLLMRRLIEDSASRGFRQMIAVIGDSAQAPSIALHRAAGFAFVGTLRAVGYKHGQWLDTPLMQLELGDGDASPP